MNKIKFTIDGKDCFAEPAQTIMEAAIANRVYIPALCRYEGLKPAGSCRICTVRVGRSHMAACTQPVAEGMVVENIIPDLEDMRKSIVEMLFVEGNHLCPTCQKSGNCELQALAYRYQMLVPRFPYEFPLRQVEPAGPNLLLDHNRCIQCLRCVRGITTKDGRPIFGHIKRSRKMKISFDRELVAVLSPAEAKKAMDLCPVGAILKKEVAFTVPIGKRKFDRIPIGSEFENKRS